MIGPADLLRCGAWRPLTTANRDPAIPDLPDLYRIRRVGRDDLDCIGQTGMSTMTLRKRPGMLRGVYGELILYRGLGGAARRAGADRQPGGRPALRRFRGPGGGWRSPFMRP